MTIAGMASANASASTSSSTSKKKANAPINNIKNPEVGNSVGGKHNERLEVTVIPVNEEPYTK